MTPGDFLAISPDRVRSTAIAWSPRPRCARSTARSTSSSTIRTIPNIVANWPNFPTYHFGPLESFTVNEKTLGGFAMANFEGEGLRGNFGVRIVQTKQTSDGWAVGVAPGTPGAVEQSVRPDRAAVASTMTTPMCCRARTRVRSHRQPVLLRFGSVARHGAPGVQPHRADHHVVHAAAVHRHGR